MTETERATLDRLAREYRSLSEDHDAAGRRAVASAYKWSAVRLEDTLARIEHDDANTDTGGSTR